MITRFIERFLIPKSYKIKYQDNIGNRKHASGYWFQFIIPRVLVPHNSTNKIRIIRWLNFYFVKRFKDVKGK